MSDKDRRFRTVAVTGGAGYVGSALVPALIQRGYHVRVLDLYLYGDDVLSQVRGPRLVEIKGDIRDLSAVRRAFTEADAVIHLACISNDPSFDLDPRLGKSVNFDAFEPLVATAREVGVQRMIYASSSSVYGIKQEPDVTEDMPLDPLTDYSRFKAECEQILMRYRSKGFEATVIRPSTVCGYARRLRLDLVVNILAAHAFFGHKIKVFGGTQLRPNIHIKDMVETYLELLVQPGSTVDGEVFNAGYQNRSVMDLAEIVRSRVGENIEIEVVATNDQRSYHVSSTKMRKMLGFEPQFTIENAVDDLCQVFRSNALVDPMTNPLYSNIHRMKELSLR